MDKLSFRKILILFGALALGQIIFAVMVVYLLTEGSFTTSPIPVLEYVVPLALVGAAFLGYTINNTLRQKASEHDGLDAKLGHFKTRVIVRSAFMEGANLLAVVAAMLTGNWNFLLFFLVGFGVFIFFRPSKQEFIRDYHLSSAETIEFERNA